MKHNPTTIRFVMLLATAYFIHEFAGFGIELSCITGIVWPRHTLQEVNNIPWVAVHVVVDSCEVVFCDHDLPSVRRGELVADIGPIFVTLW